MNSLNNNAGLGPEPYNILSLDGGGTWALLQAMALGDLYGEHRPGHDILRHFRLVVANSGGSLIAAALWANMTPAAIVRAFATQAIRERIFSPLSFWPGLPRSLISRFPVGPRYYTSKKLGAIKHFIKDAPLDIASTSLRQLSIPFTDVYAPRTDLVILAYDYETNKAKFLRTSEETDAGSQEDKPESSTSLAEAVHASTNAPVNYFDMPAEITYRDRQVHMWDGAIAGYNNPILVGVTEALANGIERRRIQILSIGTASRVLPSQGAKFAAEHSFLLASPPRRRKGILGIPSDVNKLARSIIENPPDIATYIAFFMIGEHVPPRTARLDDPLRADTRIVRMNPLMQPIVNPRTSRFDIPGGHSDHPGKLTPAEFEQLLSLDMDAVREDEVKLIQRFGQLWIDEWVNNQPILAGGNSLECEIGQRWYSQARRQARTLGLAPTPTATQRQIEEDIVDGKHAFEKAMQAQCFPS